MSRFLFTMGVLFLIISLMIKSPLFLSVALVGTVIFEIPNFLRKRKEIKLYKQDLIDDEIFKSSYK